MPYANEKRMPLAVDTTTSGDNTLIAAPGAGHFIAVDFIYLHPSGGGQTLIVKSGSTTRFTMVLDDNQPITFENAMHDPEGVITCADNEALVLNLSAGTQVTGYIKYRIVGY